MRHRRLLHRYRGLEVADAHAPFIARQNVEQLQPYRMREVLEVRGNGRRLAVAAAWPRTHIATAVAELAVQNRKRFAHTAGSLAGISMIVNISKNEEAGGGDLTCGSESSVAAEASKGCNVGVLQRPSTGVGCPNPYSGEKRV